MTDLTTAQLSALMDSIRNVDNHADALKFVKQIDALKVALESVDSFFNESVKYAMLEVEALLRVIELGGVYGLRAPHKATAEWLSKLSEAERTQYIERCKDGITIDEIYQKDVAYPTKIEKKLRDVKFHEEYLLRELKEKGVANLKNYASCISSALYGVQDINQNDLVDGARNRLLKAGAVGIGHNSGIYVLPEKASKSEILDAILCRYKSIYSDLSAVRQLTNTCRIHPTFGELQSYATSNRIELDDYNYDYDLIRFMESIGVFRIAKEDGEHDSD